MVFADRKFNGKKFRQLRGIEFKKTEAQRRAETRRRVYGEKARVVKQQWGYAIYVRKGGRGR